MAPSPFARSIPELLLHLHPFDPGLEAGEEIREELAGVLVGQLALRVELARRRADEHFRPRQHVRPELAEDAPQVVLNARAAERPLRHRKDRQRLVLPGLAWWP